MNNHGFDEWSDLAMGLILVLKVMGKVKLPDAIFFFHDTKFHWKTKPVSELELIH